MACDLSWARSCPPGDEIAMSTSLSLQMIRKTLRSVLPSAALLALGTGFVLNPVSQAKASFCERDAMLVFDASSSMALPKASPAPARIDEARQAMATVLPDIASLRRIGLMVYGPSPTTSGRDCDGIGLRFGPRHDAASSVAAALAELVPDGLTPLSASVQAAAETLAYRDEAAIIVVVTDGIDTCGGEPCILGRQLADQGAHITVHVVGFRRVRDVLALNGISDEDEKNDNLRCLAEETGGRYMDTETVAELSAALRETLGCPLVG